MKQPDTLRFAFADPPYLGLCRAYDHFHGDDGRCWDEPETHRLLIERLEDEYDGWAMALHQRSLRTILPMCPETARVAAWAKTFCSFKPGVNPAYAWEPVIFRSSPRRRTDRTVVDWHTGRMATGRGFFGAKPEDYVWWVLALLGVQQNDQLDDLFTGSGAVTAAWERYRQQAPTPFGERTATVRARATTLGL